MTGRATAPGSATPDPVGELRFLVSFGYSKLGFFMECTGIGVEYDVLTYEQGGNNEFVHKLRGRAKHPNLVLKRGVTHEKAMLTWFTDCRPHEGITSANVTVDVVGPDGKRFRTFVFQNAYPVKWTGPNLKADSNAVATETLELAYEGFTEQ